MEKLIYACVRVIGVALLFNLLVRPETGFWTVSILIGMYAGSELSDYLHNRNVAAMTRHIESIIENVNVLTSIERDKLNHVNKIYEEINTLRKLLKL